MKKAFLIIFLAISFTQLFSQSFDETLAKAEQGYSNGQYNVAIMYQYGEGTLQDLEKAFYWYTKSAKQGHRDAQLNLGVLYSFGEGTLKDLEKTLYWYTKSAEQGKHNAQYYLGSMYYNGQGTSKDLKKAIYWYTKSAEQETTDAQFNLGNMYYNGEGTSKDLKKAAYWIKKAYDNGHDRAEELLNKWEYFINAQTVTIDDTTLGALATYTFTYVTSNAIGVGTSTPHIIYITKPSGYPNFVEVNPLPSFAPNAVVKVNGTEIPINSTNFGTIHGSWTSGIQISTDGASGGSTIPAGATIEIIVSNIITNPVGGGSHTFNWRTAEGNGKTTEDFSAVIDF